MHIPHPTPLDSPLVINYRNHRKNLAYFSLLTLLVLFFFTKRQSQKGRRHGTIAPPLNTPLRAGFRQLEALGCLITLSGRAKKGLHVLRCPIFTENIGIVKSEKGYTSLQMLFYPLKVSVKRKKVFIVRDEAPHFLQALGFILLSLYVNPPLSLRSIFSLSTCDICPINVGFRLTVLAFSFCSPHPTNKILKKTSLDLSSFLGFNFDGRPIKFQIHSCRLNIVEINA